MKTIKIIYLLLFILTNGIITFAQEQENPYSANFTANYNFVSGKPHIPKCWKVWNNMNVKDTGIKIDGRYIGQTSPQAQVQLYTSFFNADTSDVFSFYYRIQNKQSQSGKPYNSLCPQIGYFIFGSNGNIPGDVTYFTTICASKDSFYFFQSKFKVKGIQRIVIYASEPTNWKNEASVRFNFDKFSTSALPVYDMTPDIQIRLKTGDSLACKTENKTFVANIIKNWVNPFSINWYINNNPVPIKISTSLSDSTFTTSSLNPGDILKAKLKGYTACNNLSYDQDIIWDSSIYKIGYCKKIYLQNIVKYDYCPGASFTIPYITSPSSNWTGGTTISAQMSLLKTFSSPITISTGGALSETTQNLTGNFSSPTGKYYVRLLATDGTPSDVIDSINITTNPSNSAVLTPVKCKGDNTGAINLSVSSGSSPYTFSWSSGSSSEDINTLFANTYNVTTTDSKSCTTTSSYVITEPATLFTVSLSGTITHVTCQGGNNGAINISATGGNTPYTYSWSNSTSGTGISSLLATTYTITATDNNSCQRIQQFNITEPSQVSINPTPAHINCNGGTNGSINISASGGVSGYTYSWNTGSTNQNLSALGAGSYTVTVRDSRSCSKVQTISLTQPNDLTLTPTINPVSSFGGSNGSINLVVSNGTPVYSYSWSTGATTNNITNLTSNIYYITITDANLCTKTAGYNVPQPGDIEDNKSITDVTCNGGSNGIIELNPTGGTTPYTYDWSGGKTGIRINGLTAGNYTVTITDGVLYKKSFIYTVSQPTALSLSALLTNVSCNSGNNGALNISVSGGTGGHTYSWSNATTAEDPTSLTVGSYTVTITDGASCTRTASYNITQPTALNVTADLTHASCFGFNNGTVNLTVSGGTPGYSYNWSSGESTQNISSKTANTFTVTVTDANSCTGSSSFTITQPSLFNGNLIANQTITCSNDPVNLTASGGNSYLWSTGSTNAAIVVTPSDTNSYYVTITDAIGCNDIDTITIYAKFRPIADAGIHLQTLYNTSIQLTGSVTPAIGNYTYRWYPPLLVADSTLINPFTGKLIVDQLYTFKVTDNITLCSSTDTVGVTVKGIPLDIIIDPIGKNNLSITDKDTAICDSSSIIFFAYATGGTENYTFNWIKRDSKGDSTFTTTNSIVKFNPREITTYIVTVNDGINTVSDTIEVAILKLPLAFAGPKDPTRFFGDTITLTAGGGDIYRWKPISSLQNPDDSIKQNPIGIISDTTTFVVKVGKNYIYYGEQVTCFDSAKVKVDTSSFQVYVPSAFTPNGDGKNDTLCVYGLGIKNEIKFQIYNRWGEMVFESKNKTVCWDGKYKGNVQHMQSYGWLLEVYDLKDNKYSFKGATSIFK